MTEIKPMLFTNEEIENLKEELEKNKKLGKRIAFSRIYSIETILTVGGIAALSLAGYLLYSGARDLLTKYPYEPIVKRANVINGPKAELFIERNGNKFYAEIDGKPISEYIRRDE